METAVAVALEQCGAENLEPAERALYAVDFISVDRLPYRDLSDSYWPDWIAAVERVESMDFDILVPGHGPVGTHEDVTLEEAKASITLDDFAHLGQHEAWLPLNVEGVWQRVVLQRRGN